MISPKNNFAKFSKQIKSFNVSQFSHQSLDDVLPG